MEASKTDDVDDRGDDLTADSAAEASLATRGAELDRVTLLSLVEASRAITEQHDLQSAFREITRRARAVLGGESASLQLLDSRRNLLVFQASTGPHSERIIGTSFSADLGIAGAALRTRRAIRVDDASRSSAFFSGIDAKSKVPTRSILAAPLIHQNRVLGVVEVLNPLNRDTFSDKDLQILEIFASLASAAASQAQALDHARRENSALKQAMPEPAIIGQCPAVVKMLGLCKTVAVVDTTVLLLGETGSGKELAAREIHALSPRCDKPFVAINCAALQETLLESELFGHEKGAFTGASTQRAGKFELAEGGTLFLDEVGEMSLLLQAKLLRVVQERELVRVGGSKTIHCDVRLIAATNRDLKAEVEAGRFRQDLYYRLSVFPIELPALRQRADDIPLLVEHLIRQIAPTLRRQPPGVSDEAMTCLSRYSWPGNIRELRNVLERCVLLAGERIMPEHLPPEIGAAVSNSASGRGADGTSGEPVQPTLQHLNVGSKLDEKERELILAALTACNWNRSEAARKLGITRDILRYRIKRHALVKPTGEAPVGNRS